MIDFFYYLFALLAFVIPFGLFFYKRKAVKYETSKRNKDRNHKNLNIKSVKSKPKGLRNDTDLNNDKVAINFEGKNVSNTPSKEIFFIENQENISSVPKTILKMKEDIQNFHVVLEEVSNSESCLNEDIKPKDTTNCLYSFNSLQIQELKYDTDKHDKKIFSKNESDTKREMIEKYDEIYEKLTDKIESMSIMEVDNNSLKATIDKLNNIIYSKEEEFGYENMKLNNENSQLRTVNNTLEKIILEKNEEIKSIKENESFLTEEVNALNNTIPELNTTMVTKEEEFIDKQKHMNENIISLQNTNDDLKKIIKEKTCEIEYLKNNNVPLLETVSFNHEVKEMKRRMKCKEEEFSNKYKAMEETNRLLKNIIEEREKDISSIICEINNLKKSEETISIEKLSESVYLKEEVKNGKKNAKAKKTRNNIKNKNYETLKLRKENDETYDVDELLKEAIVDKDDYIIGQDIKNKTCDIESLKKINIYLAKRLSSMDLEVEEHKKNLITNENGLNDIEINVSKVRKLLEDIEILSRDLNILQSEIEKSEHSNTEQDQKMSLSHERIIQDHKDILKIFYNLERRWFHINEFKSDSDGNLCNENMQLKIEIDKYRESLEKTEQMLERIQCSVEKEEIKWTSALQSSEQDCHKLEIKVKELMTEIKDLKAKDTSGFLHNANLDVRDNAVIHNATLSLETKKKRKSKNKKKVKKHAPESTSL